MNPLFQPLTLLNGTVIKNRFFKSAMSETLGSRDFAPTDSLIKLYQKWSAGGAGLLVTGNVMVDSRYLGEPKNVVLEDAKHLDRFKAWAQAGIANDTELFMQLNHPGKQMMRSVKNQPLAPSAVPIEGSAGAAFATPRAMTLAEIDDAIQRFVTSARLAKEAGFTGVQIHAAHGYLINQFLSPYDNRRTDLYGGNLANRMRFLKDIYQGIRQALGPDFPIALKLNSSDFKEGGFSIEDSEQVILTMAELGMDLIEVSGGNYEKSVFTSNADKPFFIDFASRVQAQIKTPIVVTGGFRSEAGMIEAISQGHSSMIGLARPLVLQPNLPNDINNGNYETIQLPRLTTGITALDKNLGSLIGLSYYEQQMVRIASGKPAKIHRNAWSALGYALAMHDPAVLRPRRASK